jgi:nucleotide-binding universal stress UspA family protein
VTGLFVAPPATPIVYRRLLPSRYMTPEEHAALTARMAKRYLGAVEKAAAAAGVPCETLCVTGDFVADAILRAAERRHCDLILMASRARRRLAAALLGSETQKVLAQSRIPVLVHR